MFRGLYIGLLHNQYIAGLKRMPAYVYEKQLKTVIFILKE